MWRIRKNFYENGKFETQEDEEFFWEYAIGRAKKYMKYYIWGIKEPSTISLYRENKLLTDFYKSKEDIKVSTNDKYFDEAVINEIVYLEDEELINWEEDDEDTKASKLKNIIVKYIACGEYSSSEIIEIIQNRFGISERNMSKLLSVLQEKMINKGFAKQTSSENVLLGDKELADI